MDDTLNTVSARFSHRDVWAPASIAAIAGLLFGIDTGNIAGALYFIKQQYQATTFDQELIVSITVFMAFCSAFSCGKLVDKYGRRKLILFAAVLFTLGACLGSLAQSLFQLIMARAILGIAIGISSFTAPLYIAEISPPHLRGRLVLLHGIAITFGEAIAYLIDYVFSFWEAWRLMIFVGVIPGLMLFLGMLYMPDSPHTLTKLSMPAKSLKRSLAKQLPYKALMIGLFFAIAQQLSGINVIMYYGPAILSEAGFNTHQGAIWATFILGLLNAMTTVFTMMWIDRVGRRKLMITGTIIAAIALVGFSISQSMSLPSTTSLIWLCAYIFGFCISLGSLFWVIVSEIFPLAHRARLMGVCVGIQWLANFVMALLALTLVERYGIGMVFNGFAWVCLLTALFTYLVLPETNQRTLEAIGDSW